MIYQMGDAVVGVNPPADIASGRAHIVRWTMVLRRPKRSVDLQRCAVEVCHCNCMTRTSQQECLIYLLDKIAATHII